MEAFAHKNSHHVTENIGVSDSDVEEIVPCTPLQEGIIYHFLSSPTPLYCSSFTFELKDSVDLEKLQNAWSQAQSQVQVLRTRFSPSPDGYAQIVLKNDALVWFHREIESDQELDTTRQDELQRWIAGLDGLMTQLWEVGLITSPDTRILCLNIFHALYDGNSLRLLLELVSRIYQDEEKNTEAPVPNFLDVLHLGPLCKDPSEEGFWKEHLAHCQNKSLPRSNGTNEDPVVRKIRIEGTESLDYLRKSLNVTEQAILHACWLLTLYGHYSFVPCLGIIASGRTIDVPGVTDVIGPLFNTIPSNIQLRGLKYWSEIAKRCHDYHASTIPFQYTALRDIVRWLGKNPDERLFESLFVFQRENADGESSTSKLWTPLDGEAQHEYPLAFEIARNGNETLTATLAAKGDVLSQEQAQKILLHFQEVLTEFAQNPDKELPYINGVVDEPPMTNGHSAEPEQSLIEADNSNDSSFNWGPQASAIRDAIASLAGVEVESIKPDTSIFEVGLDSIDAIKLSSRLSKLGIKLPVSSIMRHRNVKAMSAQLIVEDTTETNGTYPKLAQMTNALTQFLERENLVPQDACQILPATPIQEAMIAEMSASEFQHYYNNDILQLEPDVDIDRLQKAWKAVVKTHPILRTSFVEIWDPKIPTSYAQIVHDDSFDFRVVDLNGKPVASIIESQRLRAMSQFPNVPLLSLTVASDGNHTYLVLSIAHALYDGWSINLLHEDVARSYRGEDCTRPQADAILEQILESSGERSLKFWRATLSTGTPVAFPPGQTTVKNSTAVHRAEKSLSVSSEKAEVFCKRHGITMQALLVSCWSLVLATYVKKLDVIFGLVLSGRNVADSENVMFPTMNTVAMRVILHGTRLELVKYVQEALLEMSEHQHFPLRRSRPDARSQSLFDTLFIYQKRPSDNKAKGPVLYQSTGGASGVEYPVCVEVEGVEKDLVGRVACRGSILSEEHVPVLLDQMGDVLLSIIDEESKQTVEFAGNEMTICGHSVVQETSKPVLQNGVSSQMNGHTEWLPIESTIRSVLSIVSEVPEDTIHKTDNIFQLGLDSISAIKVAALLKKKSVKLAVSDMLREGTIEKMAKAANNGQAELTPKQISNVLEGSLTDIDIASLTKGYGIVPTKIQKVMPATAGQSYFLAMHSLNREVFYPAFYYLTTSSLKRETLENAWTRLTEQTPILRTAFIPTNDKTHVPYVQIVLGSLPSPVMWHEECNELQPSPSAERGFGSIPVVLHACQTSRGTALMLHIHHALYDAVSLPATMEKLSSLCDPDETRIELELGDLSSLVALQHLHSPIEARRQFWQRYLGQISIPDNETRRLDTFETIQQFYRPGLVSNMSDVELTAKRQSLSVQSIFLALYARVHARVFARDNGSQSLVVGLYLSNRLYDMEGLSELMAPTLNIVPLRLDIPSNNEADSIFSAARKIQDDINEISRIENASVSLTEIAEWTGVRINVCINFLRLPDLQQDASSSHGDDKIHFESVRREDLVDDQSTLQVETQTQTNGSTADAHTNHTARPSTTAGFEEIFMVSDLSGISTSTSTYSEEPGTNAIVSYSLRSMWKQLYVMAAWTLVFSLQIPD